MSDVERAGLTEAVVLIKAAPVISRSHGETVCCAGIDIYGNWLRMFPVSFRVLEDTRKFKRWDRVRFSWRRPTNDERVESRHVNTNSLEIIGTVKPSERTKFLHKKIVDSLNYERANGRSLALLKPEIKSFRVVRKSDIDIAEEQNRIDRFHSQTDLFIPHPAVPQRACPYDFIYKYTTADGDREGRCQDWETAATFFHWSNEYGERDAVKRIEKVFGEDLPARGLYFAMGTHSRWPDTWLINGLIQLRDTAQASLF